MSVELWNNVVVAAGGEADPDNKTETALMRSVIRACGGNCDNLPDNLKTTLLTAMADAVASGGGSGGGGGDNFPIGDGNTHIWISLAEGRTSPRLRLGVRGTVTVDWGDGSAPDVVAGTSVSQGMYTPTHAYAGAGDYIITLIVDDGTVRIGVDSNVAFIVDGAGDTSLNRTYAATVKKVEVGNNIEIGPCAFYACGSMTKILIPDNVVVQNTGCFQYCFKLESVTYPASAKRIYSSMFSYCYALENVSIPPSVTAIDMNAFNECWRLRNVTIPHSVTSIENQAFQNCYSAAVFDFTQLTSVPVLGGTNAFRYAPKDCVFKIPASLYDEWIAATNWSAVANTYTFVGV